MPDDQQHIAMLITDLDVGGAERNLVSLAQVLARGGWSVEVASVMPPGEMRHALRETGIDVEDLHATSHLDQRALVRAVAWLRRTRPHLLHTWLFHANLLGRVAAWLAGVGVVVSGVRVAEPRRLHLLGERLTQGLADRIVVNSEGLRRYMIAHGIRPERLQVIPNSVDIERFRFEPREEKRSDPFFRVLFVGRLDRQKGVDVLVRAAAELADVRFDLAGEGPERDALQAQARDLPNVRLLGFRPDVPELLARADALALPSRWEGMPNVLLEAMAAGVPVVATRVAGSADLVEDGVNGLLVEPDDPRALASALVRLRDDGPLRTRLAEAGRLTASKHAPEAIADAYKALYRSLG